MSPVEFRQIRVRSGPPLDGYELVIAALGFEHRSTFISRSLPIASHRVAIGFKDRQQLHFTENEDYFTEAGFELIKADDGEVFDVVLSALSSLEGQTPRRVAVDISSFSRPRLFAVVSALLLASERSEIDVDFWYAPAVPPAASTEAQVIASANPVDPSLSGWASDPALPLAVIVGVGIERDLALGVAEHLDVAKVWAFVPTGVAKEFDDLAAKANAEFFVEDYVVRQSLYDLNSPVDLFARMESLVFGISRDNRVAIVPLGPKIFALVALLVALSSEGEVAVWRFSEGAEAEVREAAPIGTRVTLSVRFGGGAAAG